VFLNWFFLDVEKPSLRTQEFSFVVQYEPPANFEPVKVGLLMNGRLDLSDLIAELLNIAILGKVKIQETILQIPILPDLKNIILIKTAEAVSLTPLQEAVLDLFFHRSSYLSLNDLFSDHAAKKSFHRKLRQLEEFAETYM
jgi:hypothetical protein